MASSATILNFSQINALFKANTFDKVYLLFGDEDYLIDSIITYFRKKFIAPGSESMDYVNIDFKGKGFSIGTIEDNTSMPPWLSEKRIVVVNNSGLFSNAGNNDDIALNLSLFLSKIPDSSIVIFIEPSVDKRKKKLLEIFATYGKICEIAFMEDAKIIQWINNKVNKAGRKINNDAAVSLISRYDKSLRFISNELGKILLYCEAFSVNVIDIKIIDELCQPDIKGRIFTITDAISEHDAAKALVELNKLIILGEAVTKIKFLFARHIKQLICANELRNANTIATELGIGHYPATQLERQSGRISTERLIALYNECVTSDFAIRNGKAQERQSLECLIVKACST